MRLWLFLAQTQGKSHYATGSSHKSKSLIDIISKPSFTTPKRDNIEINLGKAEPTLKPDATDLRLKSGHKKADQHVTIGEPPSIGPNTTKDSVTTAAALAAAKMAVRRTAYKSKQRKSLLEAIKELPYDKTMGLQMDQKEPLSTTVSNYPIQSPTLDILSRKKASKTASAIAKAIKTATDKTITRPQRSILPTEGLARQSVIPTLPTWNYNPPELLLTFLGTASSSSTIERNVSSSILRYTQGSISCSEPSGNHLNSLTSSPPSRLHMIFDCGDGTARQLGTCPIADIDRPKEPHWLFITHLHSDHFYGLPGTN